MLSPHWPCRNCGSAVGEGGRGGNLGWLSLAACTRTPTQVGAQVALILFCLHSSVWLIYPLTQNLLSPGFCLKLCLLETELWVDFLLLILLPTLSQVVNFPPALYEYVIGELGLALVLVLNKVDLAPPALVVAWKHYFHQHFPQLHIVLFTSFPRDPRIPQDHSGGEWVVRRAAGKVGW